jgi:hypothetical protein
MPSVPQHFPVRLTQAQRRIVAEVAPELGDRLKLDERNQRTIPFTLAELRAIKEKAGKAIRQAGTGMVRGGKRCGGGEGRWYDGRSWCAPAARLACALPARKHRARSQAGHKSTATIHAPVILRSFEMNTTPLVRPATRLGIACSAAGHGLVLRQPRRDQKRQAIRRNTGRGSRQHLTGRKSVPSRSAPVPPTRRRPRPHQSCFRHHEKCRGRRGILTTAGTARALSSEPVRRRHPAPRRPGRQRGGPASPPG